MKQDVMNDIKEIAEQDFKEVQEMISASNKAISADESSIQFSESGDTVTATCDFSIEGSDDIIEASINYENTPEAIYADAEVKEVAEEILSAAETPIMAADEEDNDDAFSFDDPEEPVEEDEEVTELEEVEEMEDPEEPVDIENDNNIENHYIAECNRCHGVFISALKESDQKVEFISGVCPLCEKESDQYIKWIIKPVEF